MKEELKEKIMEAKSLEELEGWKRTFSYHPVLKDDQDWDYDFFLSLIEFKLKRMREYFWTHNIVVNEYQKGDVCNKLINILHAGYETNIVTDNELNGIYVNTRNIHRFFNSRQIAFIANFKLNKYYLPTIREAKAKALFWKYLEHHIEELWD